MSTHHAKALHEARFHACSWFNIQASNVTCQYPTLTNEQMKLFQENCAAHRHALQTADSYDKIHAALAKIVGEYPAHGPPHPRYEAPPPAAQGKARGTAERKTKA